MFDKRKLNGGMFRDPQTKEIVTSEQIAEAVLAHDRELLFLNDYAGGLFQLPYSEYQTLPPLTIEALHIYKKIQFEILEKKKRNVTSQPNAKGKIS